MHRSNWPHHRVWNEVKRRFIRQYTGAGSWLISAVSRGFSVAPATTGEIGQPTRLVQLKPGVEGWRQWRGIQNQRQYHAAAAAWNTAPYPAPRDM